MTSKDTAFLDDVVKSTYRARMEYVDGRVQNAFVFSYAAPHGQRALVGNRLSGKLGVMGLQISETPKTIDGQVCFEVTLTGPAARKFQSFNFMQARDADLPPAPVAGVVTTDELRARALQLHSCKREGNKLTAWFYAPAMAGEPRSASEELSQRIKRYIGDVSCSVEDTAHIVKGGRAAVKVTFQGHGPIAAFSTWAAQHAPDLPDH